MDSLLGTDFSPYISDTKKPRTYHVQGKFKLLLGGRPGSPRPESMDSLLGTGFSPYISDTKKPRTYHVQGEF